MSTVEAPVRLGIEMQGGYDHNDGECVAFVDPLYLQLSSGKYAVMATMPLPRDREAWEADHRTARKRAWKAEAHGYSAGRFDRSVWHKDIFEINTSRDYRQGRPMTKGYQEYPPTTPLPDYPCDLHAIRAYGVFSPDYVLVAYAFIHRCGDLALVSQVLGHADHEDHGIMHLLHRHFLEAEGKVAPGVAVYNRFDSGTPGLRQFKSWIGYEETPVQWLP